MNRFEALKKYSRGIRQDILTEYVDADDCVWINDNDKDLHAIKIPLPEPPAWNKITNWGLPKEDQVFVREEYPSSLRQLEKKIRKEIKENRKFDKASQGLKEKLIHERIWEELKQNKKTYSKEIEWIREQWGYRLYGKWYFINGKPTYLCGWHWFYLNCFPLEHIGLPDYWDGDRKVFHACYYLYKDTTAPSRVKIDDEYKLQYNEDGSLKLVDLGYKTIFGVNDLKGRRVGESSKFSCINYCIISLEVQANGGIQGNLENTAERIYNEKLLVGFEGVPFYFKPILKNYKISSCLEFDSQEHGIGLGSKIDYATTAHRSFYDNAKLIVYQAEEPGKCFGLGTQIKMFDGSVKNVEDVKNGDVVMGYKAIPKTVFGVIKGRGKLYKIMPNKGESWVCNEDHILSLRVGNNRGLFGKDKYEILNISVKDYIKLKPSPKKHLMLFRSYSDYPEKKHIVDPYFLGVFLGDGCHAWVTICSVDQEIISYLHETAEKFNLQIKNEGRDNMVYRLYVPHEKKIAQRTLDGKIIKTYDQAKTAAVEHGVCSASIGHAARGYPNMTCCGYKWSYECVENELLKEFKRLNLIKNKHIPDSYLYDSYGNRLKLLAGIIDTDGCLEHKKENSYYYEITQKRKNLSYKIFELSRSLGFNTTIHPKRATMKRKDGSVYESIVYRICIFGDLYKIPCKVSRKIVPKYEYSCERKEPTNFGFKVEDIGAGDYYGFRVGGDGMFLLGDHTVVHNTKREKISARHDVVRRSCSDGSMIIGFMLYATTTYEEDDSAGADISTNRDFFDLTQDSHYQHRDQNGQTGSGLVNLFLPACERFKGFIGKYGESVVDAPTEKQLKYLPVVHRNERGEPIGAKEYLINQRIEAEKSGRFDKLSDLKRMHPLKFRDCFAPPAKNVYFNMKVLESRINYLKFESDKKPRKGYLTWRNNIKDSVVDWVDSKENPRFVRSLDPNIFGDIRTIERFGIRYPNNPERMVACADAFRLEKTDGGRMSNGGGAVKWKYDPSVDADKETQEYQSCRLILTYNFRPPAVEEYCEDMLMMCVYTGAMMYPEMNVDHVAKHFIKRGYAGYLLYDTDPMTGERKNNPGWHTAGNVAVKQELFNLVRDDIEFHGQRCEHVDYLEECLAIRNMDDMTNYDLFTAVAGCHKGERSSYSEQLQRLGGSKIDVSFWGNYT